ncbi:MAG TPA: hypothetical protein PKC83_01155 [Gemmatimonadaceae bacterium]|nr:MAG: hypothetical protein ABS52_03440 [Gemmatimonadetes bacterium SCN 70-22]HMN07364.1 hypothetical protein [Gemmatimonadaceae bacterium]
MPIWDKLKTELDRAGRVAQGALDEGKLRLEVFRARQLVDRAAQALGYAVYRARTAGDGAPDDATLQRLVDAVREREGDLAALEARLHDLTGRVPPRDEPPPPEAAAEPSGTSPPPTTSDAMGDASPDRVGL